MKTLERSLFAIGLALLALFAGGTASGEFGRRQGLAEFAAAHPDAGARAAQAPAAIARQRQPPVALARRAQAPLAGTAPSPAPVRAAAPVASAAHAADSAPIAVLRIPGIALEVPVRRGTRGPVLARGAGLVEGSPPPGSDGNVAIAAHRDGWFRGLRELAIGDRIELESPDGTRRYRVVALSVVRPEDVGVLADVGAPAITLVTCYPFTFVGRAPQRFVVRGVADARRT